MLFNLCSTVLPKINTHSYSTVPKRHYTTLISECRQHRSGMHRQTLRLFPVHTEVQSLRFKWDTITPRERRWNVWELNCMLSTTDKLFFFFTVFMYCMKTACLNNMLCRLYCKQKTLLSLHHCAARKCEAIINLWQGKRQRNGPVWSFRVEYHTRKSSVVPVFTVWCCWYDK